MRAVHQRERESWPGKEFWNAERFRVAVLKWYWLWAQISGVTKKKSGKLLDLVFAVSEQAQMGW